MSSLNVARSGHPDHHHGLPRPDRLLQSQIGTTSQSGKTPVTASQIHPAQSPTQPKFSRSCAKDGHATPSFRTPPEDRLSLPPMPHLPPSRHRHLENAPQGHHPPRSLLDHCRLGRRHPLPGLKLAQVLPRFVPKRPKFSSRQYVGHLHDAFADRFLPFARATIGYI